MFVQTDPASSGLADPTRVTYADRWQMVARNCAQLLAAVAAHVDAGTTAELDPAALKGAFAQQCRAHGLVAE